MPELCRFRGIVITIYADDHLGPHFHARYGEHDAQIAIGSAEVIAGYLPRNARRQVLRWAIVRRGELIEAWNKAQRGETQARSRRSADVLGLVWRPATADSAAAAGL